MKKLILSAIGMIISAFLIYSSAQTLDVYYKNEKAYEDAKINGLNIEQNKKGMYGFVNTKGKFIIKPIFDEVKNFKNDLAQVKYKGKWGFIDLHGKTIIEPIFDEVNEFLNNLSLVKYNNKWGIVNSNGEMVINAEYTNTPQHIQYNNTSDVSQCLLFRNENKHIAVIFCTQNKDNIIIDLKEYIHQNGCYLFITQLLENEKFKYGTTYVINNKGKLSKFDAFDIITHKHLTQAPNLIISPKDDKLSIMNINSGKTFDLPAKYTDFIIKESGIMFLGGSSQPNNFNSQYIYHAYGYYDKSKDDFVLINSLKPIVESCNNKITYIKYHKQGLSNYLILNNSTNNVIYDNTKAITEHFINNDTIIEITLDDNLKTLMKTDGTIISAPIMSIEIGSNFIIIPNIKIDNLYYNLNISDKTAEVTQNNKHNNTTTNLSIPSKITYYKEKYMVTQIEDSAFFACEGLTSIEIPNSVIKIGCRAFYRCTKLTSVVIPNSITSIEDETFYNCSSISSITIPNNVTSIGISAFTACFSLSSITIPNSVSSIGEYAFSSCNSLNSVYISDIVAWCNIKFSDYYSNPLYSAENLYLNKKLVTSLIIPESVDSIRQYTFYGCSSISSITIPHSVTSIGNYAFAYCRSLTSITIPNSVTSIGSDAFRNCLSLSSITIPNSVTLIGGDAFYYTPWLENQPDGCIYINNNLYSYKGEMSKNMRHINIKEGTTQICASAFANCSSLTSITIPNSVTSIDDRAFSGCSSLTSVTIGDAVTSIGEYAFSGCSSLTSVTIGDAVTSIGLGAFNSCSSLSSIKIGSSVTSIGNTFEDCKLLTSIYVNKNNQQYLSIDGILYNKDTTTLICCPKNKTTITIPNSVTSIGEYAFSGCSSLTSVTIGDAVTSIELGAFVGCSSLTSITIPNSVTSIGEVAFSGCSSLSSVKIGNSIISIGEQAFVQCSHLTSITIPNSVTSIGIGAFWSCDNLKSIHVDKDNQHYISVDGALYTKDMKNLIYKP